MQQLYVRVKPCKEANKSWENSPKLPPNPPPLPPYEIFLGEKKTDEMKRLPHDIPGPQTDNKHIYPAP